MSVPETITLTKAAYDGLQAEIDYWKGCADRRGVALQLANRRADRLAVERNELERQAKQLERERNALWRLLNGKREAA